MDILYDIYIFLFGIDEHNSDVESKSMLEQKKEVNEFKKDKVKVEFFIGDVNIHDKSKI